MTLTWDSIETESFSLFFSLDLINFENEIDDSIGADIGTTTSHTVTLSDFGLENASKVFFQVRLTPPG